MQRKIRECSQSTESSNLLSLLLFDTNLLISDKDIKKLCDNANRELCKVANWLAVNKLSLNVKKTHCVINFWSKEPKLTNKPSINIGNQNIEQVNSTNLFGLNIDQDLSWKHHIKQVSSKIAKLSGIMIRTRHYLPLKILQTIYFALVYSHLTY